MIIPQDLVGCTGFEPVFSSVRETRPLQTGLTPEKLGRAGGIRTHGLLPPRQAR